MPTIKVNKQLLLNRINKLNITDNEFNDICFNYGLELDDVTCENNITYYHIEIPANRLDLLCLEGMVNGLNAYLTGNFNDIKVVEGDFIIVKDNPHERKYITSAIIRNINLKDCYESFINYQDKLHLTIGRNRSLVSMGTHDFDKILSNKIVYQSIKMKDINFIPLNGDKIINGTNLKDYFKEDKKLFSYFKLLSSSDKCVVFKDPSTNTILSLPPIINSDATKISPDTKNILIEITGENQLKVEQVLKILCYNFRGDYVEKVKIVDCSKIESLSLSDNNYTTIDFTPVEYILNLERINRKLKLQLNSNDIICLLNRMMYSVQVISNDNVVVKPYPCRIDILHECDIIEDLAIAYGFNNFKMTIPDFHTTGVENHLNKFSDKIRTEMALCGFNEVLTLTLTSIEENSLINNSMNGEAVKLGNFKSKDCEIVRTSLLPGMIKAIANNLQEKLPIKIFEVSDIVKLDDSVIGASNKRYFSGIIAANTSLLEDLQGALTMVMKKAGIELTYLISDKPHFINNQSADIYIGKVLIGSIGVFNSNIVNNHFNIQYPLVGFEINLETVYDIFSN